MEMKSYVLGVITAVLLLVVIAGGFLFGKQSKENQMKSIRESILSTSQTTNKNSTQGNSDQNLSRELVKLQIKESLEEKNYDELVNIFADPVDFFVETENCCGQLFPVEGVAELKRLTSLSGVWEFVDIGDIDFEVNQRRKEFFEDAIILVSDEEYLASFVLNEDNLIQKIYINNNY